jgi:putative cardiolipin synthase
MIGTYNIDNRSNFYNSEMAVFCRGNDEFTKNVKDDIFQRAHQGIEINEDGSATDRAGERHSVYGSSKRGLLLMKMLALPSWLLRFLL